MSESIEVVAKKRPLGVRNVTRKGKAESYIPAVIYNKKANTAISLDRHSFTKVWSKAHSNTIYNIDLEGQKKLAFVKQAAEALDKESTLLHLDFYEIEAGQKIKIKVPLKFVGLAKGVVQGGILEQLASQVTVRCLPEHVPASLEIDITNLEIGDHFKVRDLKLGKGVEPLDPAIKSLVSVISTAKRDSQLAAATATPAAGAAPAEGAAAPAAGAAAPAAGAAAPAADAKAGAKGAAPAAAPAAAGKAAPKK